MHQYFRTSTVFARVTNVMPWILSKIQCGECDHIEMCKTNRKLPGHLLRGNVNWSGAAWYVG